MRRARPPTFREPLRRLLGCAAMLLALTASQAAGEDASRPGGPWRAGPYTFSDELGGFRITGARGSGTRGDPVVITQEFQSATPATMVIRTVGRIRHFGTLGDGPNGFLHLRLQTLNGSGLAWVEFEFELQELRDEPSVFGDGLSFDQRRSDSENVRSSSFRRFSRDFEPYDRLLFQDGKVDPATEAEFRFLITDFTPRRTFYIVQDPRIPFS